MTEFLLIDLSSLAYPVWHVSQGDPNPDATSIKTVARVRSLAAAHPRTAICADSGRSFRYDVDPTYKAQRPASEATLQHQIKLARETLAADGFPVWAIKGFEADDLIASAAARALEIEGATVMVASADKDLLALVNERTTVKSTNSGDIMDEAAVLAKIGVRPCQMTDYLTLVGDASDNIKGAKGIGPKRAVELLKTFVELRIAYMCIDDGTGKFQPATLASLLELRPRLETVRKLVTMRTDAPIPFDEILADRVPKATPFAVPMAYDEGEEEMPEEQMPIEATLNELVDAFTAATEPAKPEPVVGVVVPATVAAAVATQVAAARKPAESLALAPVDWNLQLEPRSMSQAMALAENLFQSRLFSAYGSFQGVLTTVLAGRELGIQAIASLRAFHIIEGKASLSAELLRALVINSKKAKFFRCTERTESRATFETQRGDDPPMSITYTVEDAMLAWPKRDENGDHDVKSFKASGWAKNPADMCVARASTKLARLVYPDVVLGLSATEEIDVH